MGDPIFLVFVVILIILFLILLLRRLYYTSRSPMDLQFGAWADRENDHQSRIPTISVAVHTVHARTQAPSRPDNVPPAAPPSFESVVSQSKADLSMRSNTHENSVEDDVPPPSYEEYLKYQKERCRDGDAERF